MSALRPIIKWPGGKSGEIERILPLIPAYNRYIEPFFGGGALFFHLEPQRAAVNDVSVDLMNFYRLIQAGDQELRGLLLAYDTAFTGLVRVCDAAWPLIEGLFLLALEDKAQKEDLQGVMGTLVAGLWGQAEKALSPALLADAEGLKRQLEKAALDKLLRTVKNHRKRPFSEADLRENLLTGFTGGFYLYFRDLFNHPPAGAGDAWRAAAFYWIREFCYGSMFRYNKKGEFNIPYGGMSYNRKNFAAKAQAVLDPETRRVLGGAALYALDFEAFLNLVQPTRQDFLFLDPPYDTDFSDYEGRAFGHADQERLARVLRATPARFILIIKNTEFIRGLYQGGFSIRPFDKRYTYNVRSRNERETEHLIISNL